MKSKLIAVVAFGAGYVAGAHAGRERYEQIVGFALRVKDDPRVQEKAHQAADLAVAKAHDAAEVAKDHLPGSGGTVEPGPFHATSF
jgi:hypothetical protein